MRRSSSINRKNRKGGHRRFIVPNRAADLYRGLFVFGESTYAGMTAAPFLSWFLGIYADPTKIHPRQLLPSFSLKRKYGRIF